MFSGHFLFLLRRVVNPKSNEFLVLTSIIGVPKPFVGGRKNEEAVTLGLRGGIFCA